MQEIPVRKLLPALLLEALLLFSLAGRAAEVLVDVSRDGDSFEVRAQADIETDVVTAWKVLTDYDRLAEFIPGMLESRMVSRDGPRVVVDQRGEATFLFLTFPMSVRLDIEERPFERIVSNAIGGNFKDLRGEYRLEPRGPAMTLRYEGKFTPDFGFPPLLGNLIVRSTAERRFGAMVREIEKVKGGDAAAPSK